ncbi:MAG: hypothetical protein C0616_09215 [Desulfuromonas sp.]|nr:MAG: hypothetical protein C0616_09215 [Desulfuromonas sp.]
MIDLSQTLKAVTMRAQDQNDLPDYLASRIFAIADQLATSQTEPLSIDNLIEQVELYDTFGQTGYLGMGVNHTILEKTIRKIEVLIREQKNN